MSSLTILLLAVSVGVFVLIVGAGLRPMLDDLFDRLGNTLRIQLRSDRRVVLDFPDGFSVDWNGKRLQKVYQQEFSIANNTRETISDIAVKLMLTPAQALEATEELRFGGLIMPTAAAEGRIEPTGNPLSVILHLSYLGADSEIEVRLFSTMDGVLGFESACGKLLKVRRTAAAVAETARRVLPSWALALKPLLLPLVAPVPYPPQSRMTP